MGGIAVLMVLALSALAGILIWRGSAVAVTPVLPEPFETAGAEPVWGSDGNPAPENDGPPASPISSRVPIRILAFGTSLSSARYDWPAALGARLQSCLGRPFAVEVVAGPGQSVAWGVRQLDRVVAAAPDLVLVEFTVNDADLRRGVSRVESAALHDQILARLGRDLPGARVVLMGMNPAFGLRGALRLRAGAYLAQYPTLAAGDPRRGIFDLAPFWRIYFKAHDRDSVLPDGLHPEPGAARAVIVPALAGFLAPLWQGRCDG